MTVGRHATHISRVQRVIELLKALRSDWLTVREVSEHVGLHTHACRRWLHELEDSGVATSRRRERDEPQCGGYGREYTLTRAFGGRG